MIVPTDREQQSVEGLLFCPECGALNTGRRGMNHIVGCITAIEGVEGMNFPFVRRSRLEAAYRQIHELELTLMDNVRAAKQFEKLYQQANEVINELRGTTTS